MQAIHCRAGKEVYQCLRGVLSRNSGRFLQRNTTIAPKQHGKFFPQGEAGSNSAVASRWRMRQDWKTIASITAAGVYLSFIYYSNCQDDLKQSQFPYDGKLRLMDSRKLKTYNGKSGGRSQGGYLTDGIKIFHDKMVFSEHAAIREMLVGNLIYTAYPELFPEVLAVQTIQDDGTATFKILSEVKPFAVKDSKNEKISMNLEELMNDSTVPEKIGENLGVAIAAHAITGNSDGKLANIVYSSSCYPIDFESAGNQELVTFTLDGSSAEKMVESLAEYQPFKDRLSGLYSEDAQVENFDPHHPLMGNDEVLTKFRDWLVASVKQDIDSGRVSGFYHKLAELSDQQLETIVDGVPFIQRSQELKDSARSLLEHIREKAKQACKD